MAALRLHSLLISVAFILAKIICCCATSESNGKNGKLEILAALNSINKELSITMNLDEEIYSFQHEDKSHSIISWLNQMTIDFTGPLSTSDKSIDSFKVNDIDKLLLRVTRNDSEVIFSLLDHNPNAFILDAFLPLFLDWMSGKEFDMDDFLVSIKDTVAYNKSLMTKPLIASIDSLFDIYCKLFHKNLNSFVEEAKGSRKNVKGLFHEKLFNLLKKELFFVTETDFNMQAQIEKCVAVGKGNSTESIMRKFYECLLEDIPEEQPCISKVQRTSVVDLINCIKYCCFIEKGCLKYSKSAVPPNRRISNYHLLEPNSLISKVFLSYPKLGFLRFDTSNLQTHLESVPELESSEIPPNYLDVSLTESLSKFGIIVMQSLCEPEIEQTRGQSKIMFEDLHTTLSIETFQQIIKKCVGPLMFPLQFREQIVFTKEDMNNFDIDKVLRKLDEKFYEGKSSTLNANVIKYLKYCFWWSFNFLKEDCNDVDTVKRLTMEAICDDQNLSDFEGVLLKSNKRKVKK